MPNMPNLYQRNPFDDIVNSAYSMASTPPFLRSNQRTTYDELGNDPAYTQLEEELKQILRAKRNTGTKAKIGNVLRAGLSAAARPNRAFGGPMDVLAAISGGMSGAQDQDILQRKLFDEEQARRARAIQAMLEERRRKAVAEAQTGQYNARAAYDNWRMNKPAAQQKYTFLTPGGGQVLKTTPTGEAEWLPVPGFKAAATEEEKATARVAAKVKAIGDIEKGFKAGEFDEAGRRARLKAVGADIPPEEVKITWNEAAKNALGPNATPTQILTKAKELEWNARPKGAKKKSREDTRDETLAALHTSFQALGNPLPGDDAERKKYYQSLLAWIGSDPEAKALIPNNVYGAVLAQVQANAGRTVGKVGGPTNEDLDDTVKKPAAAPKTSPAKRPRPLRKGDVVDGMRFIGTTAADAKNKAMWVKVTGGTY